MLPLKQEFHVLQISVRLQIWDIHVTVMIVSSTMPKACTMDATKPGLIDFVCNMRCYLASNVYKEGRET